MNEDNQAPQRRSNLGFAAFSAAGLTLLCVAIGQSASQYADLAAGPAGQVASAASKTPKFNAVDFSATGTVKGQPVVISPCER
jgi:hypothetical protein